MCILFSFVTASSPSDLLVSVIGGDRAAMVWDVRSAELVRVLRGHVQAVSAVDFVPGAASYGFLFVVYWPLTGL